MNELSLPPLKVAVLVSGNGSNLQVLIDQQQSGQLPIQIVGVISNKSDAYALVRAKNADIPTAIIDKDETGKRLSRQGFEQKALAQLADWQPDLVVLAGFMRILTPLFINGLSHHGVPYPMINLHPSLLPHYKGLDTHQRVLHSGERYHGCSVHLVTTELDAGDIIAQALLTTQPNDDSQILADRVHALEYKLLPMVVALFAQRVIFIDNGQLVNRLGVTLPLKFMFD